ncbi:hypothetical protein H2200_004433 [Cladophialophora chaetospira]|uniref:Uncharacterized protein n=1 Tax=Cladophialophora chaetospira TaxID=386627 RepID=A0AA38XD86_9EURO|nr:hypothetical protein H2200_004433 [Cladophialophora chaetospira]
MCLYSFSPCRAHHADGLARDLKSPTPDIVAAGVMRCAWYKAVANHEHHPSVQCTDEHVPPTGVKFPDGKDVCPYLVIRHDDYVFDEDLQRIAEAVLMGSLEETDRGCQKCWGVVTEKGWVGKLPGEAEKMEYLYTTSGDGEGGSCTGTEAGSNGLKRGRVDEERTHYGATASEHSSVITELKLKRRRKENPERESPRKRRRAQSTASSTLSDFQDFRVLEPSTPESEAASPPVRERSLIPDSEVIPPRPDKINKADSEDYEIHARSNPLIWNHRQDKLFANIIPKSKSNGKRKTASPIQEEDPLETSRRLIAAGIEATMLSQRSSTEEGDALVPVDDQPAQPPSTTVVPHKASQDSTASAPVKEEDTKPVKIVLHVDPTVEARSSEMTGAAGPNGNERVQAEDETTELRREVAQLRSRVAALLEEQAAAIQREAVLLKQLSKHDGCTESDELTTKA